MDLLGLDIKTPPRRSAFPCSRPSTKHSTRMGRIEEADVVVAVGHEEPDIATHTFFRAQPGGRREIVRTFVSRVQELPRLREEYVLEEVNREYRKRFWCATRGTPIISLAVFIISVIMLACRKVVGDAYTFTFEIYGSLGLVSSLVVVVLQYSIITPELHVKMSDETNERLYNLSGSADDKTETNGEYIALTPDALLRGKVGSVVTIPFKSISKVDSRVILGGRLTQVDLTYFLSNGHMERLIFTPEDPEAFIQALHQEQLKAYDALRRPENVVPVAKAL